MLQQMIVKEQSPVLTDQLFRIILLDSRHKILHTGSRPLKSCLAGIVIGGIAIRGAGVDRIEEKTVAAKTSAEIRRENFPYAGDIVSPVKLHAVQHVVPRRIADIGIGTCKIGVEIRLAVLVVIIKVIGSKSRTAGRCYTLYIGSRKGCLALCARVHLRSAAIACKTLVGKQIRRRHTRCAQILTDSDISQHLGTRRLNFLHLFAFQITLSRMKDGNIVLLGIFHDILVHHAVVDHIGWFFDNRQFYRKFLFVRTAGA